MHISSLRKKLGDDAKNPRFIRTLRPAGYMMPTLVKLSLARTKQLEKQLAQLDTLLDAHVAARAELTAKAERLQQVAGVGRVTALTVLALLPELGRVGDAQASALVGVALLNHDSGQFRGQHHIHGGRAALRRVLSMAALAVTRHNAILKAFYLRLREKGSREGRPHRRHAQTHCPAQPPRKKSPV